MGEPTAEQDAGSDTSGAEYLALLAESGTPAEKAQYIADFLIALLGPNTDSISAPLVIYAPNARALKIHLPGKVTAEVRANVDAVIRIARVIGANIVEKDAQRKADLSFLPGFQAPGESVGASSAPADNMIHIAFN